MEPTNKKTVKKYVILSPDGFNIEFNKPYYKSMKQALNALNLFIKRYEAQGYYSSVNYGRIPLIDIPDYCKCLTK